MRRLLPASPVWWPGATFPTGAAWLRRRCRYFMCPLNEYERPYECKRDRMKKDAQRDIAPASPWTATCDNRRIAANARETEVEGRERIVPISKRPILQPRSKVRAAKSSVNNNFPKCTVVRSASDQP